MATEHESDDWKTAIGFVHEPGSGVPAITSLGTVPLRQNQILRARSSSSVA